MPRSRMASDQRAVAILPSSKNCTVQPASFTSTTLARSRTRAGWGELVIGSAAIERSPRLPLGTTKPQALFGDSAPAAEERSGEPARSLRGRRRIPAICHIYAVTPHGYASFLHQMGAVYHCRPPLYG